MSFKKLFLGSLALAQFSLLSPASASSLDYIYKHEDLDSITPLNCQVAVVGTRYETRGYTVIGTTDRGERIGLSYHAVFSLKQLKTGEYRTEKSRPAAVARVKADNQIQEFRDPKISRRPICK